LGLSEIDLFAVISKRKLNNVSWEPYPATSCFFDIDEHSTHRYKKARAYRRLTCLHPEAIDAYTISWGKHFSYIFPPSILDKVMKRIQGTGSQSKMYISPNWPT